MLAPTADNCAVMDTAAEYCRSSRKRVHLHSLETRLLAIPNGTAFDALSANATGQPCLST